MTENFLKGILLSEANPAPLVIPVSFQNKEAMCCLHYSHTYLLSNRQILSVC